MKTKQLFLTCVLMCSTIMSLEAAITVKFQKPSSWSKVYLYTWSPTTGTIDTSLGKWPGIQITEADGEGWYAYTFDESVSGVNFIFNDGSGVQSSDLFTEADVCYLWDSNNETSSYNEQLDIDCDGVSDDFVITVDGINYKLASSESVEVISGDYTGVITIPTTIEYNNKTYSVAKLIEGAFASCSTLTSVTIPNSITSISNDAFRDCSSLTNVTIPESVTTIGINSFYGCSALNTIILPNSVISIGNGGFAYCSSLTDITIPDNVIFIGDGAFSYNPELTTITIGKGVSSIGNGAFAYCSSLNAITIPESVISFGSGVFQGCSSLTAITWNAMNCVWDDWASPFSHIISQITSFIFGNEVETIPTYLCCDMSRLTTITIPNSITSIGGSAFLGCSNLSEVICFAAIPPTIESNTFANTPIIKVLREHFTDYREASYWGNMNIQKFIIQSNDIYYAPLGIDYAAVTYAGDTYLDYMNEYVDSIVIPSTVDYANTTYQVTHIDDYAFADCKHLESIEIPATVIEIGESAFEDCRILKTVTFAENAVLKIIGAWAFYNCHEISSLVIPEGVTEIGSAAFYGCTYLEDLTLPATVQSIGDNCFALCSKLNKITCLASVPPTIEAKTFYEVSRSIPVYVPDASLEIYKSDIYWQEFFNIQGVSGSTTGVEMLSHSVSTEVRKVLENGVLYIIRGGEKYTIDGRKVM